MNKTELRRDMVFISHANPEDNEFSRWLALQLASEGYPTWCDLTKLLGGEDFWDDIQEAIRHRTAKFLFVLSSASNSKDGTLQEIAFARSIAKQLKPDVRDFIIGLKIDELPYDDVDIRIHRLNHISFHPSWSAGLDILLQKLEDDGVPKNPAFNRDSVCSWWRSNPDFSANQGVLAKPEDVISNWLRIQELPALNLHTVSRRTMGKIDFRCDATTSPAVKVDDLSLLTFATPEEVNEWLGPTMFVAGTDQVRLDQSASMPRTLRPHVVRLLRLCWDGAVAKHNLMPHELSGGALCHHFRLNQIPSDTIFFPGVDGKRAHRSVIGYATRAGRRRYWHYALQAKPTLYPELLFLIRGHVVFSDDGINIWTDKDKMASARRNQCAGWWNDEWRDRMLAVLSHLSDSSDHIEIAVSRTASMKVECVPVMFNAPFSYVTTKELELEIDGFLDDDDEGEGLDVDGHEEAECQN